MTRVVVWLVIVLTVAVQGATPNAEAQQHPRMYRIGLLDYAGDAARQMRWTVFREQMRELGYVEGRNVRFEPRWVQTDTSGFSKLAAELVDLKVDVIVTGSTNATIAAKRATATIAIVSANTGSDPVALGIAASPAARRQRHGPHLYRE